ncbi:MAG: terminase small subunit [Methylotenera sp.]|nr:terminase small subunit [Methylotenera sp.]MDD4925809.1 terminase small subunit [Methylotenera sp.]
MKSQTDLQAKFIQSIVYDGVSGTEAARRAGYSPASARQTASQLLAQKPIQEAVRQEQFKYLNGTLASKALKTLEQVIDDETAPHGARVQASIAILERSGIHHNIERENIRLMEKGVNEMTSEELMTIINNYPTVIQQLTEQSTN